MRPIFIILKSLRNTLKDKWTNKATKNCVRIFYFIFRCFHNSSVYNYYNLQEHFEQNFNMHTLKISLRTYFE